MKDINMNYYRTPEIQFALGDLKRAFIILIATT